MDLDEFRADLDSQLIADGLEERFQRRRVFLRSGVPHDEKFDTVEVCQRTGRQRFTGRGRNSCAFRLAGGGRRRLAALDIFLLLGLRVRGIGDDDTVFEDGLHALEDQQQTLTAGVHDARFFQDRKQFRCLRQCVARTLDDVGKDLVERGLFMFGPVLGTGLCRQTDDGQDSTFSGGHDRFIGGFDAVGQREDHVSRVDLLFAFQSLGNAAEDERQDDTGVSAGTPQHGGGGGLRDLVHRDIVRQTLQFLACGGDGHRHIGPRVAVRHREHIERIDRVPLVCDIIGRRDHGVPKDCSFDQSSRTLLMKSWNRRTRRPS